MPAVVVNKAGEAVSFAASVKDVANPLPDGLEAITVTKLPDLARQRWDAATRAVVDLTDAELDARDPGRNSRRRREAAVTAARRPNATLEQKVDALIELLT